MKIKNKKNSLKISSTSRSKVFVAIALLSTLLSACINSSSTQTLTELKVLSLLIPKQTSQFIETGTKDSQQGLISSQEKLVEVLTNLKDQSTSQEMMGKLIANGAGLEKNIATLVGEQNQLNALYDFKLHVFEAIPGIQAEYNLMTEMMARSNSPSTQIIITKNQVFIAERILRSLQGNEIGLIEVDGLAMDLETFNAYLNGQMNGSKELGVQRIEDPELRMGLESIKSDMDSIMNSEGLKSLKDTATYNKINQLAKDNMGKSEEIFTTLVQLEAQK